MHLYCILSTLLIAYSSVSLLLLITLLTGFRNYDKKQRTEKPFVYYLTILLLAVFWFPALFVIGFKLVGERW